MSEGVKSLSRIAKFIAAAGVCSRRDAEKLVLAGRVSVNGEVIEECATKVSDTDVVEVDGKRVKPEEVLRIWKFYKPKGCLTTNRDPKGRKTIFDFLPDDMPRVVTIGRLDYNTEGLLLLTNSGEYARKMELPSAKVERCYTVKIYGDFSDDIIDQIVPSVEVDGMTYHFKKVSIIKQQGKQTWLAVTLLEGKNREIRRTFEHFGLQVSALKRTRFGKFTLGKMKQGEVLELK